MDKTWQEEAGIIRLPLTHAQPHMKKEVDAGFRAHITFFRSFFP